MRDKSRTENQTVLSTKSRFARERFKSNDLDDC